MKKFRYIIAILPIIVLVVLLASPKTKSEPVNNQVSLYGGGRSVTNVQGGTATMTQFEQPSFTVTASSQNWDTLGVTYTDLATGETKNYGGSKITVRFANNSYTAYCLDPQLALPQGELVCNPINYNQQINAFMNDIGSTGGSEAEIQKNQLMFRIWAAIEGWTIGEENSNDSSYDENMPVYDEEGNLVEDDSLGGSFGKEQKDFKKTVKKYYEVYKSPSLYQRYKYLCGDETPCETKEQVLAKMVGDSSGNFASAFEKAVDVIENYEQYAESGTENIQGQIRTRILTQTEDEIVFELQSLVEMDGRLEPVTIPTLTVQCIEGCERSGFVSGHEWDGQKGRYKINLIENVCEYKINLYYDTKGAYECSTNDPNTQTLYTYIDQTSTEAVQQIKGVAPGCGETCCTEAPMIDPDYLDVNVNNCCSPTTSKVEEYKLNDLFCYDEQLRVDHYDAKCNAEAFMKEINLFCEMYCTEKVTVDLPGATTAVSGRYFTLASNPVGNTKSSYITGTKRCRVITDMGTWFNEYTAQVKQQVEYFNLYQEFSAIDKMLDEIIATEQEQSRSVEITCTPSRSTVTLCGQSVSVSCPNKTKTETVSNKLLNYSYQPQENQRQKYFVAGITEGLVDSNIQNSEYENLKIEIKSEKRVSSIKQYTAQQVVSLSYVFDKRYTDSTALAAWQAAAQSKVDAYENSIPNDVCRVSSPSSTCTSTTTVSYDCSRAAIPEEQSGYLSRIDSTNLELNGGQIDFRGFSENVKNSLTQLANLYNAAAQTAQGYEKDLTTCHNYFAEHTATELYDFDPKQEFYYSQSYLDEKGRLTSDTIKVDFLPTPGCTPEIVSGTETTSDEDIDKSLYSEVYKDKDFTATDLVKVDEMKWIHSRDEFEQFKDETYEGKKYVRNDGKVVYRCEWDEGPNRFYTLVHSGAVVEERTSEMQATIHERQYQIYLTTLEGEYETFWKISGLGTNGKFDDDFKNAGRTCANEDPKQVSMFTCKLNVEHEVVLTGYCNGVVNGTHNCDPFKEGYELVNFKVVEPSDLFPAVNDPVEVPSHQGETYAYNWVVDPEGQEVLGKIQEKGKEDLTYAPENLSYSFKITPNDMKHIKSYNMQQVDNGSGGYSDFNLTCSCPTEVNPTTPCVKCKSRFVENLANGIIELEGQPDADVSGWNNPQESLGTVRNGNNW